MKKTDKRTTERLLRASRELLTISGAASLPKDDAGSLLRIAESLGRMHDRLARREKLRAAADARRA